ncbi:hypothetical protein NECAME_13229 [Necator americanus]|uniref:Uncharacterized protein n=1 Tax=Necator americanus TaxID=51031 RepID=W2SWQ9_NECAM|nr:hypothetical protein NECAME_13229 [Necator americanus]ETN74070.1 hypothetical protein NECAME_13229 [Necator americanus]
MSACNLIECSDSCSIPSADFRNPERAAEAKFPVVAESESIRHLQKKDRVHREIEVWLGWSRFSTPDDPGRYEIVSLGVLWRFSHVSADGLLITH